MRATVVPAQPCALGVLLSRRRRSGTPQHVQTGAFVVPGGGEVRIDGQRAVKGVQRLLIVCETKERGALVAPIVCVVWG